MARIGAVAVGGGRGDMIGVAGKAVADQLGVDGGAAVLGVLEFLEHDASGAFAHHKAVAIAVVGARGLLGPVVEAGRQGAAGAKSGQRKAIDRRLGAAGDHHVGVAEGDQPSRVADRVRAGRAGGDDSVVGTLEMVSDRDLPAHQIDETAGNEKRRDAARPFLMQGHGGVVDAPKSADSRADQYPGLDLLLVGLRGPFGVAQRLRRGAHAVNDEVVNPALLLELHPVVGVEGVGSVSARHLRGDLAGQVRDVEVLDPAGPRLAGQKPAPRRLDAASDRAHHAKTGDDDPPHALHVHFLTVSCSCAASDAARRGAGVLTRQGPDRTPALALKAKTSWRKAALRTAAPGRRYFLADAFSRYLTASPTVTIVSA